MILLLLLNFQPHRWNFFRNFHQNQTGVSGEIFPDKLCGQNDKNPFLWCMTAVLATFQTAFLEYCIIEAKSKDFL